jgi:hypothetical protein
LTVSLTLPDEAKILGCDPDYNAYTGELNPTPDGTRTFRTAAGHVHVGWGADIPTDNPEHLEICRNFVKQLDTTVGMLMCIIDRDPQRRELYGKAGAFRPKSYGVEYRTPSNIWLKNVQFRRAIFELMNVAIYRERQGSPKGDSVAQALCGEGWTIERIINEGAVNQANTVLEYIMSTACTSTQVSAVKAALKAATNNGE